MKIITLLLLSCSGEKTVPVQQQSKVKKNVKATTKKSDIKETSKSKPKVSKKPAERSGQQVYEQICVSCHMVQGEGIPGVYPPLAKSDWLTKDNSVLIKIVLHGMYGEIVVNDKPFNSVMSAWGNMLTDTEVANVLTYVRSNFGNTLSPITIREVTDIRKKYETHSPWTSAELSKE
jgi:mono/diheme cytochrome c family protein